MASKSAQQTGTQDDTITRLTKKIKLYNDIYSNAIEEGSRQRKFSYGNQWDSNAQKIATNNNVAPLVQNEISKHIKAVIAEYSNNTPTPTSMATSPSQNPEEVELFNAVLDKTIKRADFSEKSSQAYEDALRTGCGAGLYFYTDYVNDHSFKQDVYVKYIDYTSVFFDPNAETPTKHDGNFCGYLERIPRDEFKATFPDIDVNKISNMPEPFGYYNQIKSNEDSQAITVAHIFEKDYKNHKIFYTSNDRVIESKDELMIGEKIIMQRNTKKQIIRTYMIDGLNVLKESIYPFKQFPIIYLSGYQTIIDGQVHVYSFGYDMEDMQRVKNWGLSQVGTMLLNLRKENFIVDTKGLSDDALKVYLNPLNQQGLLPYDSGQGQAKPERLPPPELSRTLVDLVGQSGKQIDSTLGRFEDVQGASSGDISGIARELSITQNNISLYFYVRNAVAATRQSCRLLSEMLPKIYAEERLFNTDIGTISLNTFGNNSDYKNLNIKNINVDDLVVDVKVGASFEIQKQQYMKAFSGLLEKMPPQLQAILLPDFLKLYEIPNTAAVTNKVQTYMKLTNPLIGDVMEGMPEDQIEEKVKNVQAQQQQQQQLMMQQLQQKQMIEQKELALKQQEQELEQMKALSSYQIDTERLDQNAIKMGLDQQRERDKSNAEVKKSLIDMMGRTQI